MSFPKSFRFAPKYRASQLVAPFVARIKRTSRRWLARWISRLEHRRRSALPIANIEALESRLCLTEFGFVPAPDSPIAVGNGPTAVVAADFNGDGHLDLAISNSDDNDVSVLRGDGTGNFTPFGPPIPVGEHPLVMITGDFNGDGYRDLATANALSDDVSVLRGDGAGSFTPFGPPIPVGDAPASVEAGDFNGDGYQDLAIPNRYSDDVSVLRGDGTGNFTPFGPPIPVGDGPASVVVADFNRDGYQDLATSNGGSDDVSVLRGDGTGNFTPFGPPIPVGDAPGSMAVGDFNGDGYQDLTTNNGFSDDVSVLRGDGAGNFTPFGPAIPVGENPDFVAVGDFNGDGALDLATPNSYSDDVSVLRGDGIGNFTLFGPAIPVGDGPFFLAVGDFNSDGALDFATANERSNDVSVLLNKRIDVFIDDVTIIEGDSGETNALVNVHLNREYDEAITLDYAVENGTATAGVDFENSFGSLTFLPGQTSRWIVVPVKGDMIVEGDETFTVRISNPTFGRIADDTAIITITDDDDGKLSFSIDDISVVEGDTGTTNALLTVSLSVAAGIEVSVDYATEDGTATSGSDYDAASGTLSFPAGVQTRTIRVPILGDTDIEGNEFLGVRLSNPSHGTIANDLGTITIEDEDEGALQFSVNDISVVEGDVGETEAILTVSISTAAAVNLRFGYVTENGSAITGSDYISVVGYATIEAGERERTISIPILGDEDIEGNESFGVRLVYSSLGTIAKELGIVTIEDDDFESLLISIDDASVVEGDEGQTNAVLTVRLATASGPTVSGLPVTVNYHTENGTATAGSDFENSIGTITFEPGQSTQTIVVPVNGDLTDEGDETFGVRLSDPNFGNIADDLGEVTILDDNDAHATVESIVIDDGSAQRSIIAGITVTFSDVVTIQDGAFELTNQDGVSFALDVATDDGKTFLLSFSGAGIIGGSLPDGIYTLTIHSDRILDSFGKTLDGDGDGTNGGDSAIGFQRLFGDSDGDGDVDATDESLFKTAFKSRLGTEDYLRIFDFDGDGDIDQFDRGEFNQRYSSDGGGNGNGGGRGKSGK